MFVDVHCHYASPDFPKLAQQDLGDKAPAILKDPDGTEVLVRYGHRITFLDSELTRLTSHEDRERLLQDHIQAISPPTFFFFYGEDPDTASRLCMLLNNGLAEAVREHPNRMVAMAAVPMQDARLAVAEMERAQSELNMRAVYIGSNINGRGLDEEAFWPIYEAAEAMNMPIFIHPMSSDLAGADRMREYFLNNLIGNPLDTTLAAARLIFGGVLERFPQLQVCLAHAGGYLPWAIGRMERGYDVHPKCYSVLSRPPKELLNRFYVDTIIHSAEALNYVVSLFGSDRVVCGSDYPFEIGDPDPAASVKSISNLSEMDRKMILVGNAIRLLGLEPGMAEID